MTTRAMTFYETTIGKKVVMAITGLIGFGFVVVHMLGHLLAFKGAEAYNAYAHMLKANAGVLWGARSVLVGALVLHVHCVLALVARNNAARPKSYYQRKDLATNYAALTMRYGGFLLLAFIVYHILHFTVGVEAVTGGIPFDPENPYNNLVLGFQNPFVSGFYILAMVALAMHLFHGVWSLTQTLGLDHPKYNAIRQNVALVGMLAVVLGFVVVPISVLTGALQPVEPGVAVAAQE